jgi:hypothetical protein
MPVFDELIVEAVWIEVGIGKDFELGVEAGDAAAILGRCRVLAGDPGVDRPRGAWSG